MFFSPFLCDRMIVKRHNSMPYYTDIILTVQVGQTLCEWPALLNAREAALALGAGNA